MHDHLGNPVTPFDDKWFLPMVDQQYQDFAAVVRIDRSGGIDDRSHRTGRQARSGA